MFEKILIANRGEVALRIHRACREMGILTVAVHSTADADAMHVRLADESVCIGPPTARESYLNVPAIISAATIAGADAIHPGYGFLAENASFASIVEEHGFAFIGPDPEHIALMGDKIRAREKMRELGLPVVPGSDGAVASEIDALRVAERVGYPIVVKASAGGGGKGIRVVSGPEGLRGALALARQEAEAGVGTSEVYLERCLERPRHIEVQVLADDHGAVVHLGERDCSIQRRRQKLIEESPSPALNAAERNEIGRRAVEVIRTLGYRNTGTIEFLYEDGRFYFLEMNTRLQVEHPVSEMVTGIDIVREQIRIAAGAPLGYRQDEIALVGHAIECRINAESPETFAPSPGRVRDYHPPGGPGVRFDSALYAGCEVPPYYDSMVAKLIVHARTRNECLLRLRRAIEECVIGGIETTIPLHRRLTEIQDFIDGTYHVHWLEEYLARATAADTRTRAKGATA
ncbi:MAG: acetyl-CoA carboxylase biotin carboxylase subunit [Alphaproteobacteria bacterium]